MTRFFTQTKCQKCQISLSI